MSHTGVTICHLALTHSFAQVTWPLHCGTGGDVTLETSSFCINSFNSREETKARTNAWNICTSRHHFHIRVRRGVFFSKGQQLNSLPLIPSAPVELLSRSAVLGSSQGKRARRPADEYQVDAETELVCSVKLSWIDKKDVEKQRIGI